MPWEAWSKVNREGLARYVTREAVWNLRLPQDRAALMLGREGPRQLVQAIYKELLKKRISYAPEKYEPNEAVQLIRTPAEILDAPGEGTCLDLAVLFCGISLASDLLPLLIVTDGHALAAISQTHELSKWHSLDRKEFAYFERGPFTELGPLRELIERGAYLAIECTGFARSSSLPDSVPEGRGRVDCTLTFERALAAGTEQLYVQNRPLQFALDIAVAHHHWKMEPYRPPVIPPPVIAIGRQGSRVWGEIWENLLTAGRLVRHPVQTTTQLLAIRDNRKRFARALAFLTLMMVIWFVIESPIFIWRGLQLGSVGYLLLFFALQLVIATFVFLTEGAALHLSLRLFRTRSTLVHTLPCFFYTSLLLPVHGILSYPTDILKYLAIDRAKSIYILLDRQWLDSVLDEVGRERSIIWNLHLTSIILVTLLVALWVFSLTKILSKWYRERPWKCFLATLLVFLLLLLTQDFQDFAYAFAEQVFSEK